MRRLVEGRRAPVSRARLLRVVRMAADRHRARCNPRPRRRVTAPSEVSVAIAVSGVSAAIEVSGAIVVSEATEEIATADFRIGATGDATAADAEGVRDARAAVSSNNSSRSSPFRSPRPARRRVGSIRLAMPDSFAAPPTAISPKPATPMSPRTSFDSSRYVAAISSTRRSASISADVPRSSRFARSTTRIPRSLLDGRSSTRCRPRIPNESCSWRRDGRPRVAPS